MKFPPKLNLSRFKRSMQGIRDFAILLEQAEPAQRARILEQAEVEDSDFLYKVMKKTVFFEELVYLDEGIMAEILSKISPKVLAYALKESDDSFRQRILKYVGHRERRLVQDEEEKMGSHTNSALVLGGQRQILKIARGLEEQNKFTFELTHCPRFAPKKRATAK